ncbi:MMPL family transporter [Dactylosporangium sp. McL0621]|uniref:MMPL family transporter n=1 Tax=Dactylosporangium sp. McL0621 TaxID=3415678 RepID=UPI003CF1A49E
MRYRLLTLALWVVVAAGLGPLAMKLTDVQDNDSLGSLPAAAEATRAAARAEAAFPEPDALVAVAVYVRESGLTAADRAKVDADRAAFAANAQGGLVPEPAPAADGQALLLTFPVTDDVAPIRQRLAEQTPDGLRTALTGSAAAEDDLGEAFSGLDLTLLLATVGAVALLLLLTYRSPVLWLIPLLTAGIASQCAGGIVYLLVRHTGLTVDLQSQNIMTILSIGVGVDYALLLISRYREELRHHENRHTAMAVALRRSFPAICASAVTVALGLLCLLAADLPATRGLGPVGAIAVVTTLAAMTTLLPALLVLLGRWIFWPFVPRAGAAASASWSSRVARLVGDHARPVWLATAAVLAALTIGIGHLSIGLPADETFTKEVGSITGQRLIERHYPGGTLAPAVITATAGTATEVADAARRVEGVAAVGAPARSADGRWARIEATLASEPTSPEAVRTLERLRTAVRSVPSSDALVGGDTAAEADGDAVTSRDNRVVVPLVLAVVLLVLIVLLRALVAPLMLLASVVLSYAAALGAAGLILDAIGHPRLWSAVPLQTFLFIVALGVDYTIFLMTRAREETARLGHHRGVLHALTVTGGVVTSAGVVLAATFAALTVLPMVPSVQIGVIVSVGVLIDTLLVRSLLVPALTLHIGPRVWWPAARRGPVADADGSEQPDRVAGAYR